MKRHVALRFLAVLLSICVLCSAFPPPVRAQSTATAGTVSPEMVKQVLAILEEAVITRLDAKVSLDGLDVSSGHVRLKGVSLKNVDIGVRLSARGARKLADLGAQNGWDGEISPILEILRLGLFKKVEVGLQLRELRITDLELNADKLLIEEVFAQVGARPPDPKTGKPPVETLESITNVLRRTALSRIKVQAGLEHLAARRVKLRIQGTSLEGLHIGLSLQRFGSSSSDALTAKP